MIHLFLSETQQDLERVRGEYTSFIQDIEASDFKLAKDFKYEQ